MKETYDDIKQFFKCLSYVKHQSQLYGDLKVVALVISLPLDYAKYCCFLFKWNNQEKDATKTRKIRLSGNF